MGLQAKLSQIEGAVATPHTFQNCWAQSCEPTQRLSVAHDVSFCDAFRNAVPAEGLKTSALPVVAAAG